MNENTVLAHKTAPNGLFALQGAISRTFSPSYRTDGTNVWDGVLGRSRVLAALNSRLLAALNSRLLAALDPLTPALSHGGERENSKSEARVRVGGSRRVHHGRLVT
jgi:hypothetical protein